MICTLPPVGWSCSRESGHDGPCATTILVDEDMTLIEASKLAEMRRQLIAKQAHIDNLNSMAEDSRLFLREQAARIVELEREHALTSSPFQVWAEEAERVREAARTVLRIRFSEDHKEREFGAGDYEIVGDEISSWSGLTLKATSYYRGDCSSDEQSVSPEDINAILMQTPEAREELEARIKKQVEDRKEEARKLAEARQLARQEDERKRELAQLASLKAKYGDA